MSEFSQNPLRDENNRNVRIALYFFVSFLALFSIFHICNRAASPITHYMRTGKVARCMHDMQFRYLESSYVINGADPFDVMARKAPQPAGYELIGRSGGTAPWAFILNMATVFPCIDKTASIIVGAILYALMVFAAMFIVYRFVSKRYDSVLFGAIAALLITSQVYVGESYKLGNQNIVLVFIFSLLLYTKLFEKNEYLGGAIMAFSMIKPQVALLLFITLVVRKKYRLVATSAVITTACWFAASVLTGKSMMALYSECSAQGTWCIEKMNIYAGVVQSVGSPFLMSASASMYVGIFLFSALTFVFSYKYRRLLDCYIYLIPIAFSTVWMYSFQISTSFFVFIGIGMFMFLLDSKKPSVVDAVVAAVAFCSIYFYIPRGAVQSILSKQILPPFFNSFFLNGRTFEMFPYSEDIYRITVIAIVFYMVYYIKLRLGKQNVLK